MKRFIIRLIIAAGAITGGAAVALTIAAAIALEKSKKYFTD